MEVTCRARGDRTVLNYNKRQLQDVSCLESTDEESCKSIQELHLSFNYITEIPVATLVLYSRLTSISLGCNHLSAIPPSLSTSCPLLKTLRAPNNQISVVENLEGLHNLEYLDLRCNRISRLDGFLSLTRLKQLSVSGNVVDTICWSQVPCLPSLTFLGLYGNQLRDFETTVHNLRQKAGNLRNLNLGCNPFCGGRQLSLQSVLLAMSHLSSVRVGEFYLKLGHLFLSESEKNFGDVEAEVDGICGEFASGRDDGRLQIVVKILLKLKLNFPRLESVDEQTLPGR